MITNPTRPAQPNTSSMSIAEKTNAEDNYKYACNHYKELCKAVDKRRKRLKLNKSALWALVWGSAARGFKQSFK